MREILSQRLRMLRESAGLSQKALSEKTSVSSASIGYYENGDRFPGLDIAAELADFFGVSLDYLAGRSDACTPVAADISARTGMSGTAVEVLAVKREIEKKRFEPGGWKHGRKLLSFAEAWEMEGREVDVVEISADSRGAAMSAVVDGVVIFAEVHGE